MTYYCQNVQCAGYPQCNAQLNLDQMSLSFRKRATRRTACSCGRSSAAATMTCLCLKPCSWRKGRCRELSPAPRCRTAVWPAAPETVRARAPPPAAHKSLPATATTAAPAARARDTATGRPSASEAAATSHRKLAVLERKWGLSLSWVRPPALCGIRKCCWFWLNLTLWLADGWVMSQYKVLWNLDGRTCFSEDA